MTKSREILESCGGALIDPPVISLLGDVSGRDVLDLGCGNGYHSRRMAREGARVTAIDSSASMLGRAKSQDPENKLQIRYQHIEGGNLSGLADENYDIVLSNMNLMDLWNAETAMKPEGFCERRGVRGKHIPSLF